MPNTDLNTTTSTKLSAEMKTYYDKVLLARQLPNLPFLKHGQKRPIPARGGKTIEFRKFQSLAPATTPLTEGEPPAGKELSVTVVTSTVDQFGDVIKVTDVLEATAIDPVITETVELLGEQSGETLNLIVRDILLNTTSEYNVGGGIDIDAITDADVITADDILKLQTIFKRRNIKPVKGGYYLMFLAPEQMADIMRDPLWVDVSKYAHSAKNIEDGEVGKLHKFKFVDTTLIDPVANETEVDVYSGLALGQNAYGIVDIENGSKPKTIIKLAGEDSSDKSDPLNQFSTIGWKALFTAVRLNELALIRVNSAATEIA